MYIFVTHSSVDGHVHCFCFLPFVNNASINMEIQVSHLLISSPLDIYPVVVLLDHMVVLVLILLGMSILFSMKS
jgi:hypothetical protein